MKEILKERKGITLIALVITIIVLLILAGVSIAMLTGENGILNQASKAKREQEYSSVVEGIKLAVNEYVIKKEIGGTTLSFLDWMKEEGREYLNNANEIQVTNLLGQSLSTGKGSGQKDVYKLEEVTETAKLAATTTVELNKKYEVVYYGDNTTRMSLEIIEVATTELLQETDPNLFYVEDGDIYLKDFDDYYSGASEWTIENVVIPSEVEGKEVKRLVWGLFAYNDVIKSVVIPEGVTEINSSFRYCEKLENVSLPNSLKVINGGFAGCKALKEIKLPDGIEELDSAFYNSGLTKVVIPDSVKSIGSESFSHCDALKSINIPNSVTDIGHAAFRYSNLIDNIVIPNTVKKVSYDVFEGWTAEQKIYVPFNRGEKPSGWDEYWNSDCNATIVYANGEEESANQVN